MRMIWECQSTEASNSMGAVSPTMEHHYWVEATTKTSIVRSTSTINNALSKEAIMKQNACG